MPDLDAMADSLERFVTAQQGVYDGALAELHQGRKSGHWIWFILPQLAGLGRSDVSRYYAIASLDEAKAYLAHPVLGPRLRACAQALLGLPRGTTAVGVFGSLDAMKVRSSMTLFLRADPDDATFRAVLDRYYAGEPDQRTDALLAG